MYCKNCGSKIEDGSKFCPICGAPTENSAAPAEPEPSYQNASPPEQKPSGRKSHTAIIICIAACAAVVIGVAVSLLFFSGNTTSGNSASGNTASGNTILGKTTNWIKATEKYYCNDEYTTYSEYEYDNKYTTYKKTAYDPDGEITEWREGVVDKEGDLHPMTIYNADDFVIGEYTYDDDWNRLTYTVYDDYGNMLHDYVYDSKSVRRDKLSTGNSGYKYIRQEFTFDDDRNLVSGIRYNEDGKVAGTMEFEQDSDGNVISYIYRDASGAVTDYYEFTYNENGDLLTQYEYTGDGEYTGKEECTYDQNGSILSDIHYDASGEIRYRFEYTYDDVGNLLSMIEYDNDGVAVMEETEETTYDENGNEATYLYTYYDLYNDILNSEYYENTYISY